VCAGLGWRFGLEPWAARLLFVLVLFVIPRKPAADLSGPLDPHAERADRPDAGPDEVRRHDLVLGRPVTVDQGQQVSGSGHASWGSKNCPMRRMLIRGIDWAEPHSQ
jgi:hypothetical protein